MAWSIDHVIEGIVMDSVDDFAFDLYPRKKIIKFQFEQNISRNIMTGFYCSLWSIKVIKWWYLSNTHIIDHYSGKYFFPRKCSDELKFCRTSNFPKLVVRRSTVDFSLIRPLDVISFPFWSISRSFSIFY